MGRGLMITDRTAYFFAKVISVKTKDPNPIKSSDLVHMVEYRGFEPLTSTLPVWRAPNCAKGPQWDTR